MRILLRAFILLSSIFLQHFCYSQNVKWLQGTWKGKSYLPGSDGAQYFALTLRVNTIKGTKFEGYLSTMQPADTAIRYDSKVVGEVFPGYLIINPTKVIYVRNAPGSRWQLSCINCTPAKLFYSLNDERFSFKGTIEECYKECIGTSEFVKEVTDMKPEDQDSVYALLHMEKPKDTSAIAVAEKEIRTILMPGGNIEQQKKNDAIAFQQTKNIELNKNTSLTLKENTMPKRTPLIPAGNVVEVRDEVKITLASQNLIESLRRKKPLLPVYTKPAIKNEQKVVPSADSVAARVATNNSPVVQPPVIAKKDSAATLPTGYKEREVNVMRVLNVSTDSITIRVYDNGVVDGDIVSVVYNDKTVIDKLTLTAKAYSVKIPVKLQGINTLVFHAHNLGEFPPNTARLEILWANKKEEMTVSSDLTISSSINIVYKP